MRSSTGICTAFAALSATVDQPSFKILGFWLLGFVLALSILIRRRRYLFAWTVAALGLYAGIGVMSAGWHQFVVHGRIIGSQLDGYPGPVRLQLLPPVDALGGAAPLVVTGRTRAGDMLNFLREGPEGSGSVSITGERP